MSRNERKKYFLTCAPNEDSNQPVYPHSLISVFIVRIKKLCSLGYPKCAQWRVWSDSAKTRDDANFRWKHMIEGMTAIALLWLIYSKRNGHYELRTHSKNNQSASVAQLDARPTGDQEVAGSTPAEVDNILSWRLIMNHFLRSFSPFRWFKKDSYQFQAKEGA